jgi:signal transduction histidine kinase
MVTVTCVAPMLMHLLSITSVVYLDISASMMFRTVQLNDEVGKIRMMAQRYSLSHYDPDHDHNTTTAALEAQMITIERILGTGTTELSTIQEAVDGICTPGASMRDRIVAADHIVTIIDDLNSRRIAKSRTRLTVAFVVCSIVMIAQMFNIAITVHTTTTARRRDSDKNAALQTVQNELFAGVTHDIRQPAHAISFLTEEARDNLKRLSTLLDPDRPTVDLVRIKTLVGTAFDCLVRTDHVVGGLLDTISNFLLLSETQDEQGDDGDTFNTTPVPFTLGELQKQVVAVCCPIATKRGLTFEMNVTVPLDIVFVGDVGKLRRTLINLGTNALQYTPVGGGTVTCLVQPTHRPDLSDFTNSVHLRFSVVDHGKGITDAAQATIFDPFVRGADETAGTGSGLGLSICQTFVALMGGTLEVTSKLGIGTTLSFVLVLHAQKKYRKETHVPLYQLNPIVPQSSVLLLPNQLTYTPVTTTVNVLMADDVKINRDIFSFVLTKVLAGCGMSLQTLTLVEDGTDAVDAFMNGILRKESHQPYDIVFLDHHMINMTGIEATRKIREYERSIHTTRRTPIVAVTGSMNVSSEWYGAGLNHILTKPFSRVELKDAIHKFVSCVSWDVPGHI